ncbi:MAG: VOC family protein [Sphingobacteriaceae bacterium]|nr:VOC family protein [Sphingobacteriaceae bacterium]
MKAFSSAIVIHVSDLPTSLSYYCDILGFSEDFRFGDYVGIIQGSVIIHLNGQINQGIKKIPGGAHLCIDCDTVDRFYEQIKAKGALITVSIADRHYGMRDFAVNDPDGNTLVFGSSIV